MTEKSKKKIYRAAAMGILFFLWLTVSRIVHNEIFLPSPLVTIRALLELLHKRGTYAALAGTLLSVTAGYGLAFAGSIFFSVLSVLSPFLKELIELTMRMIRSVPVASFVILILLWVHAERLSIVISCLTALPILYSNLYQGICEADDRLLAMAKVFRMSKSKVLRHIYLQAVAPYLTAVVPVALGFSLKSGIAAEIIGLAGRTVGENLYEAKLYLMTPALFAWTILIVAVGVLYEKIVMRCMQWIKKKLEKTSVFAE